MGLLHPSGGQGGDAPRPGAPAGSRCPLSGTPRWIALALLVPLVTGATHWLRGVSDPLALPLPLELAGYALTLLAAAALLYAAGGRQPWCAPWASALAAAAAIQMLLLRVVHTDDDSALPPVSMTAYLGLGLLAYLVIEAHYRDRRAGPLVVPIVVLALGAQLHMSFAALHLDAQHVARALTALAASVVAALGYLLLAAGGAFALQTLRSRATGSRAAPAASRMLFTNRGGLLLFAFAALVWEAGWQFAARYRTILAPIEPWAIGVLLCYTGHLMLHRWLRPPAQTTARWAAVLFTASTLVLSASVAMARAG